MLFSIFFPAVIAHIFNPIAKLVVSIAISSKEVKTEVEIHSLTVEPKLSKCAV